MKSPELGLMIKELIMQDPVLSNLKGVLPIASTTNIGTPYATFKRIKLVSVWSKDGECLDELTYLLNITSANYDDLVIMSSALYDLCNANDWKIIESIENFEGGNYHSNFTITFNN